MELSIVVIESVSQTRLPERHRAALLDPHDPVHDCIELSGTDEGDHNNIVATNKDLRSRGWKEWPEHLIAFATRGCGDFFSADSLLRVYVGPVAQRQSVSGDLVTRISI
jgi:hypothetical protein